MVLQAQDIDLNKLGDTPAAKQLKDLLNEMNLEKNKKIHKNNTPVGQIYPKDIPLLGESARKQIEEALSSVPEKESEDNENNEDEVIIVEKNSKKIKKRKYVKKRNKKNIESQNIESQNLFSKIITPTIKNLSSRFDASAPLLAGIIDAIFKKQKDENQSKENNLKTAAIDNTLIETKIESEELKTVVSEQKESIELLIKINEKLAEIVKKQEMLNFKRTNINISGNSKSLSSVNNIGGTSGNIGGNLAKSTATGVIAGLSVVGINKFLNPTEKLETGTKGSANISADANNSKSYGILGLNTGPDHKGGDLQQFVKDHPELGLTEKAGTNEFDIQWQQLASSKPELLRKAESEHYRDNYLSNASSNLAKAGVPEKISQNLNVIGYFADRQVQQGKNSTNLSRTENRIKEALTKSGNDPNIFLEEFSKIDITESSMKEDFPSAIASGVYGIKGHETRVQGRLNAARSLSFDDKDFKPGQSKTINNLVETSISSNPSISSTKVNQQKIDNQQFTTNKIDTTANFIPPQNISRSDASTMGITAVVAPQSNIDNNQQFTTNKIDTTANFIPPPQNIGRSDASTMGITTVAMPQQKIDNNKQFTTNKIDTTANFIPPQNIGRSDPSIIDNTLVATPQQPQPKTGPILRETSIQKEIQARQLQSTTNIPKSQNVQQNISKPKSPVLNTIDPNNPGNVEPLDGHQRLADLFEIKPDTTTRLKVLLA
jgi:hypothetical protein